MRYLCEHCGAGGANGLKDVREPASYNCHGCGAKGSMWPEPVIKKLQEANPRKMDLAYVELADVLERAFDQAASGKGKDRHVKAEGQRFEDQPICTLQRIYGTGYAFGQASKKAEESMRMPTDKAVAELLGAIVYLAAAVVVREAEQESDDGKVDTSDS